MRNITITIIASIIAIFALTMLISWKIDKVSCLSKYKDFQPEYHGLITGCLVQYKGKTVPSESLRVME